MRLLLLLGCADPADPGAGAPFLVDPVDLGAPLAPSTGFDIADGETLGLALGAVLPVWGDDAPIWNVPDGAWTLVQPDTVSDPSTCPAETVTDAGRTWTGGCRSSQGYEFDGAWTERTWDDGDAERTRREGRLEVLADVEDPAFTRVALEGAIERARPHGGTVDQHLDVNLRVEVEGYWEVRAPGDPRALTWASWTVSGSAEQQGDHWVADLAADIAGSGGFRLVTDGLDAEAACPIEARGGATLGDGHRLRFEGVDACDRCATVEGEDLHVCGPG